MIRADEAVKDAVFERRSCGTGTKGPRLSDWALTATASPRHFLLIRRLISRPGQLHVLPVLRAARQAGDHAVLHRHRRPQVASGRNVQTGKDVLGWDQCQARAWDAGCRHTALAALAQLRQAAIRNALCGVIQLPPAGGADSAPGGSDTDADVDDADLRIPLGDGPVRPAARPAARAVAPSPHTPKALPEAQTLPDLRGSECTMTHSCTTANSGIAVPAAVDEAASAMWSGLRVSRRALSYPLVSVQLAGLAGRKTGMRVIHGIWARGALCLWAEDPDLPAAPRDQAPSPALHPFACQAGELADVLAALPGPAGEAARKAVDAELTLQLPSAARPGPAARLARARPAARADRAARA